MLHILPFLKALLRRWLVLLSCAAFTVLGMYGAWANQNAPWYFKSSLDLAVFLLFVAAFLAWREEYLANIEGPQLLLEWTSREHFHDQITFRNLGPGTAFDIAVGEFSWDDVKWHMPIEVPSVNAGEFRTFDAEFYFEVEPHSSEVGYLRYIFQKVHRKGPLALCVTFENIHKSRFKRQFILSPVRAGRNAEIRSDPGKLEVVR